MNGSPAPGPSLSGWLGVLKSWLQERPKEMRPPSGDIRLESSGRTLRSDGPPGVLVVDDNPVNRVVISSLMRSRGLSPMLAADGAEAVALACELQFDLILMDLEMPLLDGLAATSAIRRFEGATSRPRVPVVAYSSTEPDAGVLARHGLNGSLRKPCKGEDLDSCLVQWCPTYRATPATRAAALDPVGWQAMGLAPDQQSAVQR